MKKVFFLSLGLALLGYSCQQGTNQNASSVADSTQTADAAFEAEVNGEKVQLFTIKNGAVSASLTNYGARCVSLLVPDKDQKPTDVILGYDTGKEFVDNTTNFYGAIVGRYGNRIGNATFKLGDQVYNLEKNDGENSLHGGTNGVYAKVWSVSNQTDTSVTFSYTSPDGEAGYPGNVLMTVTYAVNSKNGLEISYTGQTDKETVLNLTNHNYFNLSGAGEATILDHQLTIDADAITEVNDKLIPTGKSLKVEGNAFDFRKPFVIGDRIDEDNQQLKYGQGYDHNFELNKKDEFKSVATVYSPKSGVEMQVLTTEPGLQFYSGNFMKDNDPKGKGGKSYGYRAAFCLETQHFPDAPNHPNFKSTTLKPGDKYETKTEYRFATK